ncbi:MAG: SdiA-regulated domain-containing protein [Alphaproteobacteria bacterium]|nr:SdiA-regulated domain-containing protein [Alphaproteobacteria bacterium]
MPMFHHRANRDRRFPSLNPGLRSLRPVALLAALAVLAGCADHAYVGLPPGQPMRDITIPDGTTRNVPIGASLVGVAFEEGRDRLFLRILPGTQLQEVDRRTGRRIRSFSAQQVPAGCGGFTPDEFPIQECGLAMRYADRHLFLDHPSGLQIAELDIDGRFVRNIRLAQTDGPIGGLAYDQQTDTLYVLFIRSRMIDQIDLQGRRLRRLRATNPQTGAAVTVERFGLGINSKRRELYLALHNGNRLGVFDMSGGLIATHNLNRSGLVPGVGGGRRYWFW